MIEEKTKIKREMNILKNMSTLIKRRKWKGREINERKQEKKRRKLKGKEKNKEEREKIEENWME